MCVCAHSVKYLRTNLQTLVFHTSLDKKLQQFGYDTPKRNASHLAQLSNFTNQKTKIQDKLGNMVEVTNQALCEPVEEHLAQNLTVNLIINGLFGNANQNSLCCYFNSKLISFAVI